MMRNRWGLLLAVLASGAAAQEVRPALVVLDFEAKDASALQAEAATMGAARGLRDLDTFQVMTAHDVRQLLALERNRQLLGQEQQGEMDALAQSLGAAHAVAGTVTRLESGLSVELRLLDTTGLRVVAQRTAGPFSRMEDLAAQVPGAAQVLVAELLREQQGSLLVRANEEAAEVMVDDVLVATTPLQASLPLSRGTHRVQLRKDGFIAQTRPVRVEPGQGAVESFTLVPSPDYMEAYQARHGRLRLGAWAALGASVVAFGGAYLLDQGVSAPLYQEQFLPMKLALDGVTESRLTARQQADATFLDRYRTCGASEAECRGEIRGVESSLLWLQAGTVALGLAGATSAGMAVYLFLTGKDPNRYQGLVASVSVGQTPGFVLSGTF